MLNLSRLLDRREAKGGRSLQGIVVAEAGKCSRWAHNLLKGTSSLLEGATWITSTDYSETHLHSTFPLLRSCKQSTYRFTHSLKGATPRSRCEQHSECCCTESGGGLGRVEGLTSSFFVSCGRVNVVLGALRLPQVFVHYIQ